MTEDTGGPALPKAPGDSALARIVGVFFSPTRTFEAIAARPTWIAPVILWVLCSVAVSAVLIPRMDFEHMMRERLERGGQKVSDEQVQSIVERQQRFAPVFGYGGAVLAPLLITLVVAVVLWGSFRAFGWDASYPQSLGVVSHSFLPGVIGSLLLLPLIARQERVDPSGMGDLLRSNLGFLAAPDAKALHALLGALDVFSFWSIALMTIGFAAAAKVRRGQAAGIIIALWAVYVLGKAGFAAIF